MRAALEHGVMLQLQKAPDCEHDHSMPVNAELPG